MKGDGDKLASGRANKASYGPIKVSQEKWDAMFEAEPTKRQPRKKKN